MTTKTLSAAIVALLLLVGLVLWWQPADREQTEAPVWLPPGGEFNLISGNGPVTLADLRGKVVVGYFGYTYCPDVCPTSLAVVAQAIGGLGPQELERVRGLFVSVDPERDTPARLVEYAGYFHPNIIGATADPAAIADMARRYGVAYFIGEKDEKGNYTVDHSSYTYLIGPDGKLAALLPHGTSADEVRKQIRALLP